MGMTIIEKILAGKSGQAIVRPGDLVTVDVDITKASRYFAEPRFPVRIFRSARRGYAGHVQT